METSADLAEEREDRDYGEGIHISKKDKSYIPKPTSCRLGDMAYDSILWFSKVSVRTMISPFS